MSDDDAIAPVAPISADRIARVEPIADRVRPTPARGIGADSEAIVGSMAVHEQLEHPIHEPASVATTASVHDAASHGNPIAAAIERAHATDPTERAQQLGGAAASAASGQAARIDRDRDDEIDPDQHEDPLAPITPTQRGRSAGRERRDDDETP